MTKKKLWRLSDHDKRNCPVLFCVIVGCTVSVILSIERLPTHGSSVFVVGIVQYMLSSKDYDRAVKELLFI